MSQLPPQPPLVPEPLYPRTWQPPPRMPRGSSLASVLVFVTGAAVLAALIGPSALTGPGASGASRHAVGWATAVGAVVGAAIALYSTHPFLGYFPGLVVGAALGWIVGHRLADGRSALPAIVGAALLAVCALVGRLARPSIPPLPLD
jgi:hypothetical protein